MSDDLPNPGQLDFTIAHGIDDLDLLLQLHRYFAGLSQPNTVVSRQELSGELDTEIPKRLAESLFTGLALNGVAEQEEPRGEFADYSFRVQSSGAARVLREQAVVRAAMEDSSPSYETSRGTEVQLVGTFPPGLGEPEGVSVVPIADELRQLFFDADEIVRIANPYFDPNRTVTGDIASLAARGVETRILTRETESGTPGLAETLNTIYEEIPDDRRNLFTVHDLFKRDEDTGYQTFATHAKVAIADEELCYIGSANLTELSLESNFELGILVRGEVVGDVARIFDRVVAASRRVSLPLG